MNLSQKKREQLLTTIRALREQNTDNSILSDLNEIELELSRKKYGLVWEKHEEEVDKMLVSNIPIFTEVKEKAIIVDPKEKYNFLLEGDNLHSLKLLEKTHKGRINVIYIDPPYNTGNKDFKYGDSFIEIEDTYRHSKWLSFMAERLDIARKLLSDDGVIFISIDDNEQAQLKLLCDSIFGENNFISCVNIQTARNVYGAKASSLNKTIIKVKEYLLVYARNKLKIDFFNPLKTAKKNKFDPHFNRAIKNERVVSWKKILEDDIELREELKKFNLSLSHRNLEIIFNINNKIYQKFLKKYSDKIYQDSAYTTDITGYNKSLEEGKIVEIKGVKVFKGIDGSSSTRFLTPLSKSIAKSDDYMGELVDTAYRGNSWDYSDDMNNVGKEGNVVFKSGKKPLRLLKDILKLVNNKNAIVLDFFAGSGTTGHAVELLNKEDGGNRTYILCTNNENGICENITYQRLSKIQEEFPHNLKYLKTDFISKENFEMYEELENHMIEMIELEEGYGIKSERYSIVMNEDELDELEKNIFNMFELSTIYKGTSALATASQEELLQNYIVKNIPEYYYEEELEEGNIW